MTEKKPGAQSKKFLLDLRIDMRYNYHEEM